MLTRNGREDSTFCAGEWLFALSATASGRVRGVELWGSVAAGAPRAGAPRKKIRPANRGITERNRLRQRALLNSLLAFPIQHRRRKNYGPPCTHHVFVRVAARRRRETGMAHCLLFAGTGYFKGTPERTPTSPSCLQAPRAYFQLAPFVNDRTKLLRIRTCPARRRQTWNSPQSAWAADIRMVQRFRVKAHDPEVRKGPSVRKTKIRAGRSNAPSQVIVCSRIFAAPRVTCHTTVKATIGTGPTSETGCPFAEPQKVLQAGINQHRQMTPS